MLNPVDSQSGAQEINRGNSPAVSFNQNQRGQGYLFGNSPASPRSTATIVDFSVKNWGKNTIFRTNDAFLVGCMRVLSVGGLLSFVSPKESKQRKGDPGLRGRLGRLSCATRQAGRLAKLACGSDNARRLPPARLRCSALHMRPGKTSWLDDHGKNGVFCGRPQKMSIFHTQSRDAFQQNKRTPGLFLRNAQLAAAEKIKRVRGIYSQ